MLMVYHGGISHPALESDKCESCLQGKLAFEKAMRNGSFLGALAKWGIGTRLRKKSGSEWQGKVVGFYTTELTPIGYAIESESHKGSVQIYPELALEEVHEGI